MKVNIWTDPWIPAPNPNLQLANEVAVDIQQTRVASLSDSSTNSWCLPTILSYFNPFIVACIKKIPVRPSRLVDKLILREEKNSLFSVRSAY